jgi:hypothetical protein
MGVIMVYEPTYNWGGPILYAFVEAWLIPEGIEAQARSNHRGGRILRGGPGHVRSFRPSESKRVKRWEMMS